MLMSHTLFGMTSLDLMGIFIATVCLMSAYLASPTHFQMSLQTTLCAEGVVVLELFRCNVIGTHMTMTSVLTV